METKDKPVDNVINIDEYRPLVDIISTRLGTNNIVLSVIEDGTVTSYIAEELNDIELVYINKTLSERRDSIFSSKSL